MVKVSVSVMAVAPAATGLNATVTVQVPAAAMLAPVHVSVDFVYSVPVVNNALVTDNAAEPELVSVMVRDTGVPGLAAPKDWLAGTLTAGAAVAQLPPIQVAAFGVPRLVAI